LTVPIDLDLPIRPLTENPEELSKYITDLTYTLERSYQRTAEGINGYIKTEFAQQDERFTPTLNGSTSGTFTYVHQNGWVFKQGLIVDFWFDVQWSATTAAGNLQINLPYIVANTANLPFVGVVQPSAIAYTGGTEMVVNANSNSYIATFYNTGSGFTTAPQSVTASGRVIGHLRYISQQDERFS
jgi:hypothetical protein